MSQDNAKPPTDCAVSGGGRGVNSDASQIDIITKTLPLSSPPIRRRLDPKAGALKKLDAIEGRLAAARAAGDELRFGRYYLSWMRLHKIAFNYGQEASDA